MRAVHGQMPNTAQLLIDAGADVKKANSYGVTALYIAARAGDSVATQMLLAAGADANAALPASGETVLMTAAKAGNPEVVGALLTGGIDGVSLAQLGEARAAARVAEAAGYSLLPNPAVATNYADVNARERWYGRTALMIAAAEGPCRRRAAARRSGLRPEPRSTRKARRRYRWRAATATSTSPRCSREAGAR